MTPGHHRVFRPGTCAGVIRTWRDPARDLAEGRRRGINDPAEARASLLHVGTAHPLTCDEADSPGRADRCPLGGIWPVSVARWVSSACLTQPGRVEAGVRQTERRLGCQVAAGSLHRGISVLCVLHRVTVPIHILHMGIRRRERELSTPCTANFRIYTHPATCCPHSAPQASPPKVHPCSYRPNTRSVIARWQRMRWSDLVPAVVMLRSSFSYLSII